MKIEFNAPREVVMVPERKTTVDSVEIRQLVDMPDRKRVQAYTDTIGIITLWEGAAYDAIGQWTDTDVVTRINELYPA